MISRNLRRFRVFLAVAELGSLTAAAARVRVSQPAVTQAMAKLEHEVGAALFDRTPQGLFLTERGRVLRTRLARAMGRLDRVLAEISPRLILTATAAQLQALIAVAEAESTVLASEMLGRAQPTVHRAISQLEGEAGRALFERTAFGLRPIRTCLAIAEAARLAFSEIDQANADLAEVEGRDVGRIVVGALPLARSVVLPRAIAAFRERRPGQLLSIIDGPYLELLAGLRRGDVDLILGALRDPAPVPDVAQERLFDDRLVIVARPGHPLAVRRAPLDDLIRHPFAVPRTGTPSRSQFDALIAREGAALPSGLVECGSILLMRELLGRSDMLGCISARQAEAEVRNGLLVVVPTGIDWPRRPIGLTTRAHWLPTHAQCLLIEEIRAAAAALTTD